MRRRLPGSCLNHLQHGIMASAALCASGIDYIFTQMLEKHGLEWQENNPANNGHVTVGLVINVFKSSTTHQNSADAPAAAAAPLMDPSL